MSLFDELKRRNVFKVGIAYAVTTWILLQLTDVVSDMLALPEWAPKLILLMLVVGFIPALIMAWAFELTPEGMKLEKHVVREESIAPKTGRKLDYLLVVLLGLAVAYIIWESRFESQTAEAEAAAQAALVAAEQAAAEGEPEPVVKAPPPVYYDDDIDPNSIAVLPFANRSDDSGDAYFTDGIHDDLLTQLSRIEAFSVISRTSVMEYRDTQKNLKEIARELGVANVMEGSVQRAGERVRINVQLIDANTDEHLWAEIYDRELTTGNLFDIQSEIAKAIAEALKATLTASELASVADVPTDNVEAYDLYLQARRFVQGQTTGSLQTAIELYREALALDPDFKLALIDLANAHMTTFWQGGGNPADRDLAREAIDRARTIDASFAELFMAEGFYWYWGFLDYERALYNLGKAIEMMPGNDEVHMWRGYAFRRAGQWEQARQSMQQALRLNPRVHFNWQEYAQTFNLLHRFEEARSAVARARELDPDSYWGKTTEASTALGEQGDTQTAMQLTIGAQHTGEFTFVESFLEARIYARRFDEALAVARAYPANIEIQRSEVILKEDWSAQVLWFMGDQKEARLAASAALFRLNSLRTELGEDYRLYNAEARLQAILGHTEKIGPLIASARALQPSDALADSQYKLDHARSYGIAGMASDAIEILDPILSPPSTSTIHTVGLDPAFDAIRDNPEFAAMLERHQ